MKKSARTLAAIPVDIEYADRIAEDAGIPEFYCATGSMTSFDGTNFHVRLLGTRMISAPLADAPDDTKKPRLYQQFVVGKIVMPPVALKALGEQIAATLATCETPKSHAPNPGAQNFQQPAKGRMQ